MQTISLLLGDITTLRVDAIVNAANPSLLGGGGVDGAIHQAAGAQLVAECAKLGGCNTGEAKITAGYQLAARHVIHTVGPIWSGGQHGEAELLAACYRNSLNLADQYQLSSIAFPAISAGIYAYPLSEATQIAIHSIQQFLSTNDTLKVTCVCFNQAVYQTYATILNKDP